jgi:hypothetical protein
VVPAPVAGVKLSVAGTIQPDRIGHKPAATVTRRIRRRGEHGISRKAIAQGMPECSVCTCMLVCVFRASFAHETAGAASTRHSLRPLIFWANDFTNLGRIAPRDCGVASEMSPILFFLNSEQFATNRGCE